MGHKTLSKFQAFVRGCMVGLAIATPTHFASAQSVESAGKESNETYRNERTLHFVSESGPRVSTATDGRVASVRALSMTTEAGGALTIEAIVHTAGSSAPMHWLLRTEPTADGVRDTLFVDGRLVSVIEAIANDLDDAAAVEIVSAWRADDSGLVFEMPSEEELLTVTPESFSLIGMLSESLADPSSRMVVERRNGTGDIDAADGEDSAPPTTERLIWVPVIVVGCLVTAGICITRVNRKESNCVIGCDRGFLRNPDLNPDSVNECIDCCTETGSEDRLACGACGSVQPDQGDYDQCQYRLR